MAHPKSGSSENWAQLAGHKDSIVKSSARTISKLKAEDSLEAVFYRDIQTDPMRHITPRFHREYQKDNKNYIEIEDLLQHFNDPSILDIKMGTRTFLESETENPKERADLYEKMVALDPNEPTPEERAKGKITKLRYMQFRENTSSSSNLGLRLEAIKPRGLPSSGVSKSVKTIDQVADVLINTLAQGDRKICKRFLKRLKEIEKILLSSDAFRNHELIGSSLLFFCDDKRNANIWLIDFAKAVEHQNTRHSVPWQLGNHEDGYLIGLSNLIRIFDNFLHGTSPK